MRYLGTIRCRVPIDGQSDHVASHNGYYNEIDKAQQEIIGFF